MSQINILATLQNHCAVPQKAIFRGKDGTKLKVDYWIDNTIPATFLPGIQEKLKEVKSDGTVTYTKAGETIKTSAELIKEGKPITKPQKEKVK
jgi:hypothetical protein